jgi:hypothetical protein
MQSIFLSLTFVFFFDISWYGWSADAGIHWIMPIIGTAIFGFGKIKKYIIYFQETNLVKKFRRDDVNIVRPMKGRDAKKSINFCLLYSLPVQLYLVDSFTYAASVTSGAAVSSFIDTFIF